MPIARACLSDILGAFSLPRANSSRAYQMHSPFNVETPTQISMGNPLTIRSARILCLNDLALLGLRHRFRRQLSDYWGRASESPDLSSWSSATAFLALHVCSFVVSWSSATAFLALPASSFVWVIFCSFFRRVALCYFHLVYRFLIRFLCAFSRRVWHERWSIVAVFLGPCQVSVTYPRTLSPGGPHSCSDHCLLLAARFWKFQRKFLIQCTLRTIAQKRP